MKKKQILTIAMVLSIASILAVGGSLAYFTDKDNKENVFTTGDVDITLAEEFEQNSKLLPGEKNLVKKVVNVKNEAESEDAYVRVHIAVPEAAKDYIHLVEGKATNPEASLWTWSDDLYTVDYEGGSYVVYSAVYRNIISGGSETDIPAIESVYMDKAVTNEIITALKESGAISAEGALDIHVMAEGVQAAGFADAEEAFAGAFGTLTGTNNPFTGYENE